VFVLSPPPVLLAGGGTVAIDGGVGDRL
jgi:hypothetical protein